MSARGETDIHPSAVVEPGAQLGQGCHVGPFCHVGPDAKLGDGVTLKSHVVISGDTEIGEDCTLFPFACIGEIPQDLKFRGEKTKLVIGARNRIRVQCQIRIGHVEIVGFLVFRLADQAHDQIRYKLRLD